MQVAGRELNGPIHSRPKTRRALRKKIQSDASFGRDIPRRGASENGKLAEMNLSDWQSGRFESDYTVVARHQMSCVGGGFAPLAPTPQNEVQRLQALARRRILDTPPESEYTDIARLAAAVLDAPIALIGFIDSRRVWFKAAVGFAMDEVARDVALYSATLHSDDVFVVADAAADVRFADSPLVMGEPRIRFYASAPLITPDGFRMGALSVADRVGRQPSPAQCEALRVLAAQLIVHLELRCTRDELARSNELQEGAVASGRDCVQVLDVAGQKQTELALRDACRFNEQIIDSAPVGIMVCDTDLRYRVFNPFMEKLTGKEAADVLGKAAPDVFPGLRSSGLDEMIRRALSGEVVHTHEVHVPNHSAAGEDVWESCSYAPQRDSEGNVVGAMALVTDVTERHRADNMFRALVMGTASATGADFFPSLVEHLARALGARYSFIAECDDQRHARALAFWRDHDLAPNFEFDVTGTPCERVVQGETCHYRANLQSYFPENKTIAAMGAESYLGFPILDSSCKVMGHMVIVHDKPMESNPHALDLIRIFAARAAAEMKRRRAEVELEAALEQVRTLQKKLEAENLYLQEEIQTEHNFEEIVGRSPALLEVLNRVETVAPTDSTVLILGESGCGKELIARAIHSRSKRGHRPLVKLNCGAIPTGLVESELFGHVKGAFTGALDKRVGRFELADGGTLFLDEVSELPLDIQVKLLRVLQEREFEPVGSSRTIEVNVRIVAASNRDLAKAVREGRFRADLYYRLNVLPISLPPLRERRADIPLLAAFFIERFSRQLGKHFSGVTADTMDVLSRYDWPGNVRELQNVIERAAVLCPGPVLKLRRDLLPVTRATNVGDEPLARPADAQNSSLQDVERAHIIETLCSCNWVIEGAKGAAKVLALHPNTLRSRMKKLGITRAR